MLMKAFGLMPLYGIQERQVGCAFLMMLEKTPKHVLFLKMVPLLLGTHKVKMEILMLWCGMTKR